jgi:hypothetical protein
LHLSNLNHLTKILRAAGKLTHTTHIFIGYYLL